MKSNREVAEKKLAEKMTSSFQPDTNINWKIYKTRLEQVRDDRSKAHGRRMWKIQLKAKSARIEAAKSSQVGKDRGGV